MRRGYDELEGDTQVIEQLLKLVKQCSFRIETRSGLINPGPAYIISAHLVASSAGAATATIYDGHGTIGSLKANLTAPQSASDPRTFIPPIYCEQGIYLDVGLNVTSVSIQFRQAGDLSTPIEPRSVKSFLPTWLGGSTRQN